MKLLRAAAVCTVVALATPAGAADWWRDDNGMLVNKASVKSDGQGRLVMYAEDPDTNDRGLVAVDCVIMVARGSGDFAVVVQPASTFAKACAMWAADREAPFK